MARFLSGGHFTRSLNRARGQYRRRRDTLVKALRAAFGTRLSLIGAHTGLHLVAVLRLGLTERELVDRARKAGVRLWGLSHYGTPPSGLTGVGIVLGYGTLSEEEILASVKQLASAWKS